MREKKKTLDNASLEEIEHYQAKINARAGYLHMKQLEFEQRQRNKALRLARKNKAQAEKWIL